MIDENEKELKSEDFEGLKKKIHKLYTEEYIPISKKILKQIIKKQIDINEIDGILEQIQTLKDIKASCGIESNGGTGDITVDNAVLTLTAETANSTTNTTTSNTVKKDNTVTASTKLPKTGLGQAGIISIVVVAIIGIFSYILYKKTSKVVK